MKINLKVRFKNPQFWIGLAGVVIAPVLAYNGAAASDLKTWSSVGQLITSTISNPYLLGSVLCSVLGFLGVINDPTVSGLSDSNLALTYEEPKKE